MNKKRNLELEKQVNDLKDEDGMFTFYSNPEIDYLFGLQGGAPVPTKQDGFRPIVTIEIDENGVETPLNDLYIKRDLSESIKRFTADIKQVASKVFTEETRIRKPDLVEVIISVSALERRFKEVDVDNLAKCILDGLNGIAFEDDSQVSTLICKKFVHEMNLNSVLIGITKLTSVRKGVVGDVKLFSSKPWEART